MACPRLCREQCLPYTLQDSRKLREHLLDLCVSRQLLLLFLADSKGKASLVTRLEEGVGKVREGGELSLEDG